MKPFEYAGQQLRTIDVDGTPWFVASDACRIIGVSNTSNALRALAPDEKSTIDRIKVGMRAGAPALIVNESGLYKLIMRSDKPEARAFQDWVTREVLPAIRRTGGYLLNEHARETAHADTRDAMPLPAEVMQVFQAMTKMIEQQTALMGRMVDLMREKQAAASPVAHEFTKNFYTAREVVAKLRKAGAAPTHREFSAATVRTGQQLAGLARTMGERIIVTERYGYPVSAYPKAVVEAYAAAN